MPSDTKPQLTPYDEKIIKDVVTEGVGTENLDPDRVVEEKALVRKLDFRILPIACLLYFCSYRFSNPHNYRFKALPTTVLDGKRCHGVGNFLDPHGKLANCNYNYIIHVDPQSTVYNYPGLVVCRLFLGVFDSGFGPVIPLYFSFFYTKREMGLRMAYWFGFATVAGAFGGLIAFGIQHIRSHISNWKILFIVEGSPSVLLAILALFLLPNRPESTSFFNERERALALERMNRDSSGDTGATINKAHIWMAFKDWRIYTGGVIYLGVNCALSSTSAFLPTIIKTLGYSNARAQLFTVPPYACAAVVMVLFSWASDRIQSRGIFMAAFSAIGGIGYLLMFTVHANNHVRYFATFCIVSGTYTTIGMTIAWFTHNLGSETKKATGIPMFMAIGQCGSIIGAHIFPLTQGPLYTQGFATCCALEFLAAVCALILSISYRWENARRDRLYGKPTPGVKINTHELADKAPEFRYIV